MTKKHVWIIRATSVWTFYVWGVLVRNMVVDHTHSLAFRAVHVGLAAISFAFAGALWWVSNLMSREIKDRKRENQLDSDRTVSRAGQ